MSEHDSVVTENHKHQTAPPVFLKRLNADGTYVLPISLFEQIRVEKVKQTVDKILVDLWNKDPQTVFLVSSDKDDCKYLCKPADLNHCIVDRQRPRVAELSSFTELLRGDRFRGLLVVVVGTHDDGEEFEPTSARQLFQKLISASPSAAWWKHRPVSSLELLIKMVVDNCSDVADILLVGVNNTSVCVARRETLSRDPKCDLSVRIEDAARWDWRFLQDEWQETLGELIWEHSAFLREGFLADPRVAKSRDGVPADYAETIAGEHDGQGVFGKLKSRSFLGNYNSKILDWVATEASPWSSDRVSSRIKEIVNAQAYIQSDRSKVTITLLSLLRIARWLAVQNLEGTPLSTTFFAYPNWSAEGGHWEELLTSQGQTINAVLERRSLSQTVSVVYRDDIRKLAELALNSRAFLKVDLSAGQIIGMCEDHLTKEDSRFDRFGQLTAWGGVIVHTRPEGYVEVYFGGEFVLWFDGFDWHSRPFQILDSVCEEFFKDDFVDQKQRSDVRERFKSVVAELLDQQRSSILVLAPRTAISDLQKTINQPDSKLHTTRKEARLSLRDIEALHISTLSTLFSMDCAHFITSSSDPKNPQGKGRAEICEIGLLFKSEANKSAGQNDAKTSAGSGTDAARMLSEHVPGSFVLKVSGSGDLKIFHQGVRLWSSNVSSWPPRRT